MPDVVYDPNRGRISSVSAEEQLAKDQRDFLFRSQLAARQEENEQRRMRMANDQMSAQERMHAEGLAAQLSQNGTFGDRTLAARDLQDMAGRQQLNVIGAQGKNSLDAARIAIGPQTAELGQRQREYEDQRNDRMNDPNYIMGKMEADMLRGTMPGGGASAKAGIGPTTSGALPGNQTQATVDTSLMESASGESPVAPSSGMQRAIPGANQYQFDDKSARTQASMLDQLQGSVDPERFKQAVAMLDNSRKQQGQRDVDAQKAKVDEVKMMMVNAGVQPKSDYNSDPMAPKAATDPLTEALRNSIIKKHGGVTPEMKRQNTIDALKGSPNIADQQMGWRMQADPSFNADVSKSFSSSNVDPSALLNEIVAPQVEDFASRDVAMSPWQRAGTEALAYGGAGAAGGAGLGLVGGPLAPVTSTAAAAIGGGLGLLGGALHGFFSGRADPSAQDMSQIVTGAKKAIDIYASKVGDREVAKQSVIQAIKKQIAGRNESIGSDKINALMSALNDIQ